jgi:hypothetical protein
VPGLARAYGPAAGDLNIGQVITPLPEIGYNTTSANATNNVIWTVWNNIHSGTITATANIIETTGTMTNTATNITTQIWGAWNAQIQQHIISATTNMIGQPINVTTTNQVNNLIWTAWNEGLVNLREATAEQVAEAQRRARAEQEYQVRVQAERGQAEKRAEKLLQETLTPKQREELAAKGYFELETIAKSGERRIYRIKRGRSRNIEQVDDSGRRIKTLCAHPIAQVPDADTMVAQKLMLESQEDEFLRIAYTS